MVGLRPDTQEYFLCSFCSEFNLILQSFQFCFKDRYISFSLWTKEEIFPVVLYFWVIPRYSKSLAKLQLRLNGHFKFKSVFWQIYTFLKQTIALLGWKFLLIWSLMSKYSGTWEEKSAWIPDMAESTSSFPAGFPCADGWRSHSSSNFSCN